MPVLLVFWRRAAPVPNEVEATLGRRAERYAGRALVAKVDADAQHKLVDRFDVATGLPARMLLRNAGVWLAHVVEGKQRPAPRSAAPPPADSAHPVVLTDANFQQVVSRSGPVLVDFWAPWCGPAA